MRLAQSPLVSDRSLGRTLLACWLLVAIALEGCGKEAKIKFVDVSEPPTVRLIQPPVRKIVRVVGQPSFIQAYEHTAIYAKLTSFVESWLVDIGDKVKKGDVLAKLFMPELVQEYETKKADVQLAKELVDRALNLDIEANADVEAAVAHVAETQSLIAKFQSEADRWTTEVGRLKNEVERGVVDRQILLESTNQMRSNVAALEASRSTFQTARAQLSSRKAAAATSKVDVGVARARLTVASSEQKRVEALVGYLTLTAPFDGIIVVRNANTGDFVISSSGDPSARPLSPGQSPDRSAPVFVVDRIDKVRIFVDIPEDDADFVEKGTKATVLARAFRSEEIPASVTRTSWALNVTSRTLRAEIDLPNPGGRLLPGMYAYGKVVIERPEVRALPLDALTYRGEQTFCWIYEKGLAVRTEIRTGVSDGDWIEITNRRVPGTPEGSSSEKAWGPIDGSEQVILGDLSILTDGSPVKVDKGSGNSKVTAVPQTFDPPTRTSKAGE
jgi:HlyD family secretion protein